MGTHFSAVKPIRKPLKPWDRVLEGGTPGQASRRQSGGLRRRRSASLMTASREGTSAAGCLRGALLVDAPFERTGILAPPTWGQAGDDE